MGYALLPLGGARALTDSAFPTDSTAFLGNHSPSISLTCAAEVTRHISVLCFLQCISLYSLS